MEKSKLGYKKILTGKDPNLLSVKVDLGKKKKYENKIGSLCFVICIRKHKLRYISLS